MKKFQFRLEKVLAWRNTQLEVEKLQMKQSSAELRQAHSALEALEKAREAAGQELLEARSVAGWSLAALAGYNASLGVQERSLKVRRSECERRHEEQRSRLLEAQRRCRLLEKLKQRRLAEYQEETSKALENFGTENYLAQWISRERNNRRG